MVKTLTSFAVIGLLIFLVSYYFAPLSTVNFLHSVWSFIIQDRGQGDTVVRGIQS